MAATYQLWLTSDSGVRLADLSKFLSLEASRVVNGIGSFRLQMPLSFNSDLIQPDRLIQVWRQPTNSRLGLWRVYLLRRWKFSTRGSNQELELSGPDVNDLLRRRIVAAYSGSSQASKTDYADDMMKEIVTEALADGVAPVPSAGTRVWSNLSVAGDVGLGPTITDSFSWDGQQSNLLLPASGGVLTSIAKKAKTAGTEVFFDVVPNVVGPNSITFRFETYINQPGQDVSDRVKFDQSDGNMKDPMLEYDYTEEKNYIYAGGQGEQSDRNIQQVYDSTRYGLSIWNRCEGFADARSQSTSNGVRETGRAALEDGRPRIRFTAQPVDTQRTRFGIDWDFGYKVQAKYLNRQFICIIRAVTIKVMGGEEDVRARLDYEAAV